MNFTEPDGIHSTKYRNPDEVYNRFEMYAFILGQECKCM